MAQQFQLSAVDRIANDVNFFLVLAGLGAADGVAY
jgi:hypothetical protein